MRRILIVVALAAVSGCTGLRTDGVANSFPAGTAALRSSVPKPGTLFAAIFAGSLPGAVAISAPPYTSHGATDPLQGPVNVGLTNSGSLIVAGNGASAVALSIIKPPYTGKPSTISTVFWAGGMALDQGGDIFLAQGIAPRSKITYLKEYLAPDYTQSVRFATNKQRFITAVTALPNGLLAVGSVRNGPNDTSLPGNLTIYSPPYTKRPTTITDLTYVSAMTIVPKGLIVVVCSQCFTQSGGAYLALVSPPFDSVTKVLAKLPNVTASAITSTSAGDIFVKQDTFIYHYAPPYTKGEKLPNTSLALETMTTAPNGDLFFGARASTGISFAINRLPAPYTGQPQTLFTAFGPPAQMTVSK